MSHNRKNIIHGRQESENENNDEIERGAESSRIIWSTELFHLLCDLCIKHLDKSKGKSGAVTAQRLAWKEIESEFQKKTNLPWDKSKLKNKIDWMRVRWSLWKQLKGKETGLGWDHEKGTISATDEWWAMKIKENHKFETFRNDGYDPEIEHKMDQIFGCTAQGKRTFTPVYTRTQEDLEQEDVEVYVPAPPRNDNSPANVDYIGETYAGNSSNSWDDFWGQPSPTLEFSPMPTQQDTHIEGNNQSRCKRSLDIDSSQHTKSARTGVTKKVGGAASLSEKLEIMVQLIADKTNASKEANTKLIEVLDSMSAPKNDTIADAMAKLCHLPDLAVGSPEFLFACTLIEDPQKRAVLLELPDDKVRVQYIKYMFEKENHH